jgi:hypothetical protein
MAGTLRKFAGHGAAGERLCTIGKAVNRARRIALGGVNQ